MEDVCKLAYEKELDKLKAAVHANSSLVNVKDNAGRTPLHWSSSRGHWEAVKFLLQKRANVDEPDDEQWTPLMCAVSAGHDEIVDILLKQKANPNAVNRVGNTALHYAASKNRLRIAETLLADGAVPNARNAMGSTPLHRASSKGDAPMVTLLLDSLKETDDAVNAMDAVGNTPLHLAYEEERLEVCKVLSRRGADAGVLNEEKKTPPQMATRTGR